VTPPTPARTGIIGKGDVALVEEWDVEAWLAVASGMDGGGGGGRAERVEPSASMISIVVRSCFQHSHRREH